MGIIDRAAQAAQRQPRDEPAPGGAKTLRALTGRELEAVWRDEMLRELRLLRETSSDAAARSAGQIVNSVLDVRTVLLDATGTLVLDYHVMVGSVIVTNPNATGRITVASGTQSGDSAPTAGRGVQRVPASTWLAIPIGSRAFTVWGTAGAEVGLQVFAGMQAFGVSR